MTMQAKRLALCWGQQVLIEAGLSGRLQGAYLAPRLGEVSHVVVRHGILRRAATLPLGDAQQDGNGALVLPLLQDAMPTPGRGAVPLSGKTTVHCSNGLSLPLQGLILSMEKCTVDTILVGSSGNARVIPREHVRNIRAGSPSVGLGQSEIERLPIYRSDAEAQRNAAVSLAAADPTGDTFRMVVVRVVDGVAYLSGNVRLSVQKGDAERAVRQTRGVLDAENAVATDWDLEIAIAEALAKEGLTRQGLVMVRSSLGRVTLKGHLASHEMVEKALSLANGMPGVTTVEQGIEVQPLPAPETVPVPETAGR
ncbi:MAG: BON domain-containing protein [Chloroflexi bacterium]|nr:BON domain-containing protein [Chloroflexota bacterium]